MKLSDDGGQKLAAGTYPAVVTRVVDLGTQVQRAFSPDESAKAKPKLWIQYEVFGDEGSQFIGKRYTASLFERATLRKDAAAILGDLGHPAKLDANDLLGRACLVSVAIGNAGYLDISGVMALPKAMPAPVASQGLSLYDITGRGCAIPADLPAWVAATIMASPEWSGQPLDLNATAPAPAPAVGSKYGIL